MAFVSNESMSIAGCRARNEFLQIAQGIVDSMSQAKAFSQFGLGLDAVNPNGILTARVRQRAHGALKPQPGGYL